MLAHCRWTKTESLNRDLPASRMLKQKSFRWLLVLCYEKKPSRPRPLELGTPPPKQGVSQHSCPSWLACQEMLPGLLQILFFFQHTKNLITLLICSINYMLKWYYFGNIWLTHWIYFTCFIFFFNEERKFYSPNGKKNSNTFLIKHKN